MFATSHAEVFPATSVARNRNVVVVVSATVTGIENVPPAPTTTDGPCWVVHWPGGPIAPVYARTVLPTSAVPLIEGLLLFAGEVGVVVRLDGGDGGAESSW